MNFRIFGFALTFLLLNGYLGFSQKKKSNEVNPQPQVISQDLLGGLNWRLVGPFRGGRAGTVTGVKGARNLYYMGTAGGGVWKTTDGGQTWQCISDGYFGGSIGAVAVADSNPSILYVGEGEQTLRGNVSSGKGIWKSNDAGKSWQFIGLPNSEHIARIRIHPTNPDIVYVAVIGNLWKPSAERGVYKTIDGGKTWKLVLFESDKAGAGDLILDPLNPSLIYASTWEMKRNGYRMDSGGPGSKLWRSKDGGETWENISTKKGLPGDVWGIVGIAISPINPERIWAIIENKKGGIYRSDNGGETWHYINSDNALRQRAWYYSRIYADTESEDIVYVMNVDFHVSGDGGKTFKTKETPHGDHHDLWIDPMDNQRMIVADDGGAQVSTDAGNNWTTYYNQPTAQFYRVTTDTNFPFRILGAQQDNSTVRILHRSPDAGINEDHWDETAGGESAHLAPDPQNPEVVYGGTYKGYMSRYDHETGQERSTNIWPVNPAGSGVEVMKYRFNWNFPVTFSLHTPKKLFAGSNYLHVTYNEGQTWEVISPDLTRNDPETLKSSGGPITQDNTGVEYYGTVFVIEESPHDPNVIYTGSDDGLLHVTKDGGKTWQNITPPNSPRLNMFNCIDVDPHHPASVYVAASHYKFGDYTPYLYKSEDYGKTWKSITSGIPSNYYTRAIRADLKKKGLLYAGTEWGMFISFDDGSNWQPFNLNLPIVSIRDLHVREDVLIAATHGRSFWMIDDLHPIRNFSTANFNDSHFLYPIKPAYRLAQNAWRSDTLREGKNHTAGAAIHFWLKNEKDTVTLSVKSKNGEPIRSWTNYPSKSEEKLNVKSGGNVVDWNLRYAGFTTFPGMVLYSSPNQGPKAVPGDYEIELTVNGQRKTQALTILADPRLNKNPEEYKRQLDFLLLVRDKVSEGHTALLQIAQVRKQLQLVQENLIDKEAKNTVKIFMEEMEKVENNIHQTKNKSGQDALNYGIKVNNRLAFLLADQQRGDYPPTDQAYEVFEILKNELDSYLAEWKILSSNRLNDINAMLRNSNQPYISLK